MPTPPIQAHGDVSVREPERRQRTPPALIAHRGCALENPENTTRAVQTAAGVADAIEIDVRRCKTGELVVFHDARLDRVTTARGRIDETPLETLRELEVANSEETIPPLDSVFDAIPAPTDIVLDLKEPGLVEDVLELHAGYDHDILISSFYPEILAAVRDTDPSLATAYIVEDSIPNRLLRPLIPGTPDWLYLSEDVTGMIEQAQVIDCDAIHPRYELCLRTNLVQCAHDAGLRVRPWTITTQREYDMLRDAGVDAVISDICAGLER